MMRGGTMMEGRHMNTTCSRTRMGLLVAALLVTGIASCSDSHAGPSGGEARTQPTEWTAETLKIVAAIPMQEQGRVKPLSTYAAFTLLRIHHKRSFRDPVKDRKLNPTEWLLDTLFFPEASKDREVFLIEDTAVLDDIGVKHEGKKKRDRFSYNAIAPGLQKLMANAQRFLGVEDEQRSPKQELTLRLAHSIRHYESLLHFLQFARTGVPVQDRELLAKWTGDRNSVTVHEALTALEKLRTQLPDAPSPEDPEAEKKDTERRALIEAGTRLMQATGLAVDWADAIVLLPPGDKSQPTWLSIRDMVRGPEAMVDAHLDAIRQLEAMMRVREDASAFEKETEVLGRVLKEGAERRGEYGKIKIEVFFYKLDPFYRALVFYLLGFVLLAVTWLKPNLVWLRRAVWAAGLAALAFNVAGVTLRCIVRGRPPVLTLYDTIVFITAISVGSAMVIEWINKRRVALATAIFLGALGLFLAMRYEEIDGRDTMQPLIAVLDTNFWLATHVTCIVIGYSAGLLAAALGHVYVLGRLFGLKKGDKSFYRAISRMIYGVICFSLFFSVVGTILGGIWANVSWGRFWGWDPKENGALLICLSQLTIIHARMGGYIREQGIAMAAVFSGCVIAFSWWGVNQLGIGLHSYGFTRGIILALKIFYGIEGLVLFGGAFTWFMNRKGPPPASAGDAGVSAAS